MFFAVTCWDRPNAGELREKTRVAHLDYLKRHADLMHVGGPFESADGAIVGTLFIIDVPDEAAARAWVAGEPFHQAGVFEESRVRRWRQMQPEVEPGADEAVARAGRIRLEQEDV